MNTNEPPVKRTPKICIIGDSNVGKTSIINRFVNDSFVETQPSIGACHSKKKIRIRT